MKKKEFRKLGLALAGGGGKGAYQIGILKALLETHLLDKVQIMAGTSVGALNEILFLHKDFHLANYLWRNRIEQSILYLDKERLWNQWQKHKEEKFSFSQIKDIFFSKGLKGGIFSRDGLINILKNEVNLKLLHKASKKLYATATCVSTKTIEYFDLNKIKDEKDIIDVLLASSAIPGIFGYQNIKGRAYYDGGVHSNVPIDILYQEGCDLIIVLHLFRSRDKIFHDRYPEATIIELTPEYSLGGILDFSPKSVRDFINRGYRENIDILSSLDECFYIKNKKKFF